MESTETGRASAEDAVKLKKLWSIVQPFQMGWQREAKELEASRRTLAARCLVTAFMLTYAAVLPPSCRPRALSQIVRTMQDLEVNPSDEIMLHTCGAATSDQVISITSCGG